MKGKVTLLHAVTQRPRLTSKLSLLSPFQLARRRRGLEEYTCVAFIDQALGEHTFLALSFHWPELSHVAIRNCKEGHEV